MKYQSKIIITKNRVRVIKSSRPMEKDYKVDIGTRDYFKTKDGDKSDYSYKRAKDNLFLTADCNINKWSKFLTLTFKEITLDYKDAQKKFNQFTRQFKRIFGENLKYTKISERQKKRGLKENNQGSWHFHLLVYNSQKIEFDKLKKCWSYGSIDIKNVNKLKRNWIDLPIYFTKYFTKEKGEIALNDNLVSHSQGLKKPKIIYQDYETPFDNWVSIYETSYIYIHEKNVSSAIQYTLTEYSTLTN